MPAGALEATVLLAAWAPEFGLRGEALLDSHLVIDRVRSPPQGVLQHLLPPLMPGLAPASGHQTDAELR